MRFILPIALACTMSIAQADIAVDFIEGAPKDRFRIVNLSPCPTGPVDVVIDLSGSRAGLIFDTTGNGAGVEVFQPFELVEGGALVLASSAIRDGDSSARLSLADLPGESAVAFTIDVDDTLTNSSLGQIRVAGNEIEGAEVRILQAEQSQASGSFDASGRALAKGNLCLS